MVLRALPNLEKLDNVDVTPEEVAEALRGGGVAHREEEAYEDAYSNGTAAQQSQNQQSQQQQQPQQQQQQQQQWRQQSPVREVLFYFLAKLISHFP